MGEKQGENTFRLKTQYHDFYEGDVVVCVGRSPHTKCYKIGDIYTVVESNIGTHACFRDEQGGRWTGCDGRFEKIKTPTPEQIEELL